ncbi:MAG: vanadium-dependent haloperoxidase [Acidimicrobiales bacterium]
MVTDWNAIAARTIFTENTTPIASSALYFGFVSIAVYDAVVAIEGGFEPYLEQRGSRNASSEAAAATAAYRVLRHYFPASAENLRADYRASLADIPRGDAMARGKRVGETAAEQVIRLRRNDGRDAKSRWWWNSRRAYGGQALMRLLPWPCPGWGFVKPLLLDSPTQIPLPGPDALDTDAYARDFAEVKAFGAKDGSSRSAEQTETALFWNANSVLQYQVALRDQVTRRGMDIADSARAFALLSSATADSLIACWRAKYDFAYWRPVTAIRMADTDGNDATAPDPAWTPLVQTPPYPDYTSGHACISGVATGTLSYLFGADAIDLDVFSSVTGTSRHYDSADALDEETMNARIWLGIHFRKAMTDGNQLGHDVSDWGATHYFQPTG